MILSLAFSFPCESQNKISVQTKVYLRQSLKTVFFLISTWLHLRSARSQGTGQTLQFNTNRMQKEG